MKGKTEFGTFTITMSKEEASRLASVVMTGPEEPEDDDLVNELVRHLPPERGADR